MTEEASFQLAYRELAPSAAPSPSGRGRTVVLLHGLMGSSQNWWSWVRRMAAEGPADRWILPDLRHHGRSGEAPGKNDLETCAEDLERLFVALGHRPEILIGHSFGGKVALALLERQRTGRGAALPLEQVWTLDTFPGRQAMDDSSEVSRVIRVARSLAMPAPSRAWVVEQVQAAGLPSGIAQWMTTNLERRDDGYHWTFDPRAIAELAADYGARDYWPLLEDARSGPVIHLVVAEQSDRWDPSARRRAAELGDGRCIRYHLLPRAGHWLHVDNPAGLAELVQREGLSQA